jgi:hypothetical protein
MVLVFRNTKMPRAPLFRLFSLTLVSNTAVTMYEQEAWICKPPTTPKFREIMHW